MTEGDHAFQFSSYGRPLLQPRATGRPRGLRLCQGCRERVDDWDARFDGEIARVLRGANPAVAVRYDSWLPRYAAALAWHGVISLLDEGASFAVPAFQAGVLSASERWRAFATGDGQDVGPFHLHLLPIPTLDGEEGRGYAEGIVHQRPVLTRTGEAWMWMKRRGALLLGTLAPGAEGALINSRLETSAPSVWGDAPVHVPAIARFLMFEEWRRSTHTLRYAVAEVPCRV
jgi:hypothetical protein